MSQTVTTSKTPATTYVGRHKDGWVIPTHMWSSLGEYKAREALEAAGIYFHGNLPDYDQLQIVTLPEGWKIQDLEWCRDGARHTNLLDGRNRVRAVMRQKKRITGIAARERSGTSHMIVACPFIISFKRDDGVLPIVRVRKRYGRELMSLVDSPQENEGINDFKLRMFGIMKAKLTEKFPDWQTSPRYWDIKT